MAIKKSVENTLPVLLYDVTDFITPETGVAFGDVSCFYTKQDGAEVEKTLSGANWTEIGHGVYEITFTADELDTVGIFTYQITDDQTELLDFNGRVNIETVLLSDITGSGDRAVIFHCKTSVPADIADVRVTVYSADDSNYVAGPQTTDVNGNTLTFYLDDATYSVRFNKAGALNESQSKAVTEDATIECTLTVSTPDAPADPDVCRLYIYVTDISNAPVTGVIKGKTLNPYTEVSGRAIKHVDTTFDTDTVGGVKRYYLDVTRGAKVKITSDDDNFGMGGFEVKAPDQADKDLSTLFN